MNQGVVGGNRANEKGGVVAAPALVGVVILEKIGGRGNKLFVSVRETLLVVTMYGFMILASGARIPFSFAPPRNISTSFRYKQLFTPGYHHHIIDYLKCLVIEAASPGATSADLSIVLRYAKTF